MFNLFFKKVTIVNNPSSNLFTVSNAMVNFTIPNSTNSDLMYKSTLYLKSLGVNIYNDLTNNPSTRLNSTFLPSSTLFLLF